MVKIDHKACWMAMECRAENGPTFGKGESKTGNPKMNEVWEENDEARFDLLVEKELSGKLTSAEHEELELLNQRRDVTLTRISDEEMERENLRWAALNEVEIELKR